VRFLADENLFGPLVRALRKEGHDVTWVLEIAPGTSDQDVLERSHAEARILLTQDWDFGELAVRERMSHRGIVIIATDSFEGSLGEVAERVTRTLREIGDDLIGRLTVITSGRTRQRELN
jgi:predicted nuclease of predicted toxin-antitoxin system